MKWIRPYTDELEIIVPKKNVNVLVDLDEEDSIGSMGAVGKVVPVKQQRKTGTGRLSYDDALKCPHCTGRMHMNLPSATINFECMFRQFCLATGKIETPDDRLPPFTHEMLPEFDEWATTRSRSRKKPLSYGKMEATGGAPTTYAAMRSASKSVDDVAGEVDVKPRKRAAKSSTVIPAAEPVKGKAGKVKASKSKDFSLADSNLELDDDEPVARASTKIKKQKPAPIVQIEQRRKGKQRPEPVKQPTATAKSGKASSSPPKAATAGKRAAARR